MRGFDSWALPLQPVESGAPNQLTPPTFTRFRGAASRPAADVFPFEARGATGLTPLFYLTDPGSNSEERFSRVGVGDAAGRAAPF